MAESKPYGDGLSKRDEDALYDYIDEMMNPIMSDLDPDSGGIMNSGGVYPLVEFKKAEAL